MRFRSSIPVLLLCASTVAAAGCRPEEIELEAKRSELRPEGSGPEQVGGCAFIGMLGGSGTVEIAMAALPRTATSPSVSATLSEGPKDDSGGVGAGQSTCPGTVGENEVSIALNRHTVLRENILAPVAKQSAVLAYAHTAREPRLTVADVDLSSAGPGMRRVRISNYIEMVEPIQLVFYDAADEAVGESEPIAWGETWTATIPSVATGYRVSPEQPLAQPFDSGLPPSPGLPGTADLPCVAALPLGLVVTGSFRLGAAGTRERYTYLPPLCL